MFEYNNLASLVTIYYFLNLGDYGYILTSDWVVTCDFKDTTFYRNPLTSNIKSPICCSRVANSKSTVLVMTKFVVSRSCGSKDIL